MGDSPSTTGANGRAAGGRFGQGNKCARGNPHAKHVARLRSAMLNAVKPADLREVVASLLGRAKAGDVPAARELLQRLLGPPVELDMQERLDALERTIAELRKREP